MAEEENETESKLNYYVTFPSASNSQRHFNDIDPVIILFGWAGCQDRYLIKYSDIWLQQGCITIRYICPSDTLFWYPESIRSLTDQLVDEIFDKDGLDLGQNPVVFHLFSGAGCNLLLDCLDSLKAKNIQLNTRGIVFDSAPGESSYWTKAVAYNEALASRSTPTEETSTVARQQQPPSPAHQYFWSYLYYWYFWLFDYVKFYKHWKAGGKRETYESYFERLSKVDDLPSVQLYLYSKVDRVCSHESIEKFVKIQREKIADTAAGGGDEVQSICFEDTSHCQHLRTKKSEYAHAINEFLDKIFKSGDDFVRVPL